MSAYFLLGKSWNATSLRLGEDPDAPRKFTGCEEAEATIALSEVFERYQFIRNFIRSADGSCDARAFELAFITISPPDTVDFATFRETVQGFLSKSKCIKRWFMAFEQRGTVAGNDTGRGRHVHILCDVSRPTTFANFKRSCYTAFRGWYLDVRPKLYDWEDIKVAYLKGDKQPDKLPLVEGDRAWRTSIGIEPFYCQNWA